MWRPNIPQPGDAKSVSQGQILENFQYLDGIVLGTTDTVNLTARAAKPVLAADQMGLYVKDVAGTPAMFIEKQDGTEIDFTTAILGASTSSSGQCTLPCGLKLKWGSSEVAGSAESKTVTFTGTGLTNFSVCFSVFITCSTRTGAIEDYILCALGVSGTGFTATRGTKYIGTPATFYWFALGK